MYSVVLLIVGRLDVDVTCHLKIRGASWKFKNQPRPLLRPRFVNFCQNFWNLSHETVYLKEDVKCVEYAAYSDDPALRLGRVQNIHQPPHRRQVNQAHKLQRLQDQDSVVISVSDPW